MSLSSLTSFDLQRILDLIREKEQIQRQIERINRQLAEIESSRSAKLAPPAPKHKRNLRRGGLKEAIIERLRAAGKDGLGVNDLAASISASPGSVAFGCTPQDER
jgi:hypothetical protein